MLAISARAWGLGQGPSEPVRAWPQRSKTSIRWPRWLTGPATAAASRHQDQKLAAIERRLSLRPTVSGYASLHPKRCGLHATATTAPGALFWVRRTVSSAKPWTQTPPAPEQFAPCLMVLDRGPQAVPRSSLYRSEGDSTCPGYRLARAKKKAAEAARGQEAHKPPHQFTKCTMFNLPVL